jgi:hypothetical protein
LEESEEHAPHRRFAIPVQRLQKQFRLSIRMYQVTQKGDDVISVKFGRKAFK